MVFSAFKKASTAHPKRPPPSRGSNDALQEPPRSPQARFWDPQNPLLSPPMARGGRGANSKLVSRPPESESLITQLGIRGGGPWPRSLRHIEDPDTQELVAAQTVVFFVWTHRAGLVMTLETACFDDTEKTHVRSPTDKRGERERERERERESQGRKHGLGERGGPGKSLEGEGLVKF